MTSDNERKDRISNPFLNPMGFSQNYFPSWVEASRFYENTLKANEQWFKNLWDLWLRSAGDCCVLFRFGRLSPEPIATK